MNAAYGSAERGRLKRQVLFAFFFLVILVAGWFYPLLGFFIPICMILGLAIAFWRGRKWCDWLCPRGSFYDGLISKISPKKKIPPLLKSIPFRIAALVFLMSMMAANLFLRWPSPDKIGAFFVMLLGLTTLLGIFLAIFWHPRSWCSFCPIGTIINFISKRKYPLWIDSSLCLQCKVCAKACPIQLAPYKFKKEGKRMVLEPDCFKCGLCIAACPTKALSR